MSNYFGLCWKKDAILCNETLCSKPQFHYLFKEMQEIVIAHIHIAYTRKSIQQWTKKNLWKTVFKKFEVIWYVYKGCLPQILLGPFLNTLSHMLLLKISYQFLVMSWRWLSSHKVLMVLMSNSCCVSVKNGTRYSRMDQVKFAEDGL